MRGKMTAQLAAFAFVCLFALPGGFVGQHIPRPVFENLQVKVTVSWDGQGERYAYSYSVTNPAGNTATISTIALPLWNACYGISDRSAPDRLWFTSDSCEPQVGLEVPNAPQIFWGTTDNLTPMPTPGTTSGPFGFRSFNPPSYREAWVRPEIMDYVGDNMDDYDYAAQEAIEASFVRKVPTLAPLGVIPNTFEHWDTFLADVAKCGQLGWISDSALLSGIQSNLSAARQAALAQNQTLVNSKLQAVIAAIQASTPSQRSSEGYALVYYNAQYLQQYLPWPCEPKLTLAPSSATHILGERHTATAKLVNIANGLPMAGNYIEIRVTEGPHAGQRLQGTTTADGLFTFAYTGTKSGVDTLQANTGMGTIHEGATKKEMGNGRGTGPARQGKSANNCTAESTYSDPVKVTWSGGPDLEVIGFIPPVLTSAPGRTFYITETTMNSGNLLSGPSTTHYYLATSSPVDPSTALVVGERTVPTLAPGERSSVETVPYVIPASLPAGNYFLDACADAGNKVAETNEGNNCASSRVQVMGGAVPTNRPPDCTKATASPALLWPPNHKPVAVSVTGVTDPDGDPVTVQITGITQDEATDGLGDGDTCPDGFGVGTGQAQLRAERSGTGNGRVYAISFTATDAKGGSCQGMVKAGVPHDKKDTPVDDGQRYDSTKCP